MDIASLKKEYMFKRGEIAGRLRDFESILKKTDECIFAELAYCICTAQAKAAEADKAIRRLVASGLLYKGGKRDIKPYLRYVRFWNNKAAYIVAARRRFTEDGRIVLKKRLNDKDPFLLREELTETVLGLGYKEASHFLRNIGLGQDLAILDRYIIRCLKYLGVVKNIPRSITRKRYLVMEARMKIFSEEVKIPMDHLDLLLWSSQTGRIFK